MKEPSVSGDDARLLSLFSRYRDLRDRGLPASPSDVCPDDPALAARLEDLIEAEARMARLAQTRPPANHETITYHGGADTETVPALARYEVLGRLGNGGMGVVYRARDRELKRDVALKVIRPDALTDDLRRRFLVEAEAVAALDHPNIVKVFDVGEWAPARDSSAPYLALEFVPGGSLSRHLGKEPLDPREAARLVRLLARAVAHAHARGIVHRDLKPDNVLIAAPADEPGLNCALGCPKVTDFGLARREGTGQRMTQSGAVMGTPAYMAPEQARGEETGPPADVYALGVILYRLLTGREPFEAPSAVELMYQVIRDEPPAPGQLRPGLSEELEALCLACLSKDPGARPTATDLVARLGTFVNAGAGQTEKAHLPPGPPRNRRLMFLAGAALVALVGLGVWYATRPGSVPELLVTVPTRGSVDLLVYRVDDTGSDVLVPLGHHLALPLRTGDHFKIVAEVDRPAYLYLFWVDETGAGVPVYPWKPGEWGTRPVDERRVTELDVVAPNGKGFQITGDANGMETILMLARSTKLEVTDHKIRVWFAGLNPLPFRGPQARVWFENFDVVRQDEKRAFKIHGEVMAPDGPLGMQSVLEQRIGSQAGFSRAISFARVGPKQ